MEYFMKRNITEVISPCYDLNLKKQTIWLQLHAQLIAFDYITIREKMSHSLGCWDVDSEAWFANWLNMLKQPLVGSGG